MFKNLLCETRDGIAFVTINRPQARNALNIETIRELADAIRDIRADDAARAVIITGSGDKAFVAGADIKEIANQTALEGKEFSRLVQSAFDSIEDLGKPVIAAVNGFAL